MKKNLTPDFQAFWDAYGLKRERIGAEHVWNRLSAADKRAAIRGIEAYKKECQRRGISMKYAQGYLSHRRWEDDLGVLPLISAPAPPSALDRMEKW